MQLYDCTRLLLSQCGTSSTYFPENHTTYKLQLVRVKQTNFGNAWNRTSYIHICLQARTSIMQPVRSCFPVCININISIVACEIKFALCAAWRMWPSSSVSMSESYGEWFGKLAAVCLFDFVTVKVWSLMCQPNTICGCSRIFGALRKHHIHPLKS